MPKAFTFLTLPSQLPDEMGLSSLWCVDEEIEAQKVSAAASAPPPEKRCPFSRLPAGGPHPSPVALHLAQGPAWPVSPSPKSLSWLAVHFLPGPAVSSCCYPITSPPLTHPQAVPVLHLSGDRACSPATDFGQETSTLPPSSPCDLQHLHR